MKNGITYTIEITTDNFESVFEKIEDLLKTNPKENHLQCLGGAVTYKDGSVMTWKTEVHAVKKAVFKHLMGAT